MTEKTEQKEQVQPIKVYSLSMPVAILYTVLLWYTSASMATAAIGYVALGLSFGLLQVAFEIEKPYKVAFFSTALAPLIAYTFVALVGLLVSIGIVAGKVPDIPNVSGSTIPIASAAYTERLGMAGGIMLFVIVISLLVIAFGITGVSGRFLGETLYKMLVRLKKAMTGKHTDSDATKEALGRKEIEIEKLKLVTSIIAAIVSAMASIIVALVK
ncbi:hypothetical protein D6779_09975 [Candidatus Parcubacteria bacterium]|nr:MAG: hypothetical protein D6779_09975 [Candidatus Parcubacteria bacterium]